jgi:hypothetical protein
MTWWTRTWVTLLVLVALAVVGTGVVIVRHVLTRSLGSAALLQESDARLATLAPALPGLAVQGSDQVTVIACAERVCASAARRYLPTAHTTVAEVLAASKAWAGEWGLGNKGRPAVTPIVCGRLSLAPANNQLCDLTSYEVPGQTGQQVRVYAELAPGPGPGRVPGSYLAADVGRAGVISVYVQVVTSVPW